MTEQEHLDKLKEQQKEDQRKATMLLYGITEEEYELFYESENNLNTDKGYEAYAKLQMSIEKRNGDTNILFDLAADFEWDDRLSEAVDAIFAREGYLEEHLSHYPKQYWEDEDEEE